MSDYHHYHSPQLQRLIEKSEKSGWSISELDWNQPVILAEGMEKSDYIDMISQLYYAEMFTLKICARLLKELPDFQAVRFVCAQMNEESRHADAYAAYLKLLGGIGPVNEKLNRIFDKALAWKGSCFGLIVALNVVMEGEALNQQQKRIDTLPCPIFKQINTRIIQDESRHAGFGLIYLQDKLPQLPLAQRKEISDWIQSLWGDWKAANENRYTQESAKVLRTSGDELDSRLKTQVRVFQKIGLIA